MKKGKWMYSMGMLVVLIASLIFGNIGASKSAEASSESVNKVVGYYTSWGAKDRDYQVEDIDGTNLTHINYAFADICWNGVHGNPSVGNPGSKTWKCQDKSIPLQSKKIPNGTVVLGDPEIDVQRAYGKKTVKDCNRAECGNFAKLADLKEKHPHIKTLIAVGGWSWSNRFSDAAADPATRKVFAESSVAFIRAYGFDGVDLDWEYPVEGGLEGNSLRPEDKENYTSLLQEIRNELDKAEKEDGKQYVLTIAAGISGSFIKNTELSKIAGIVDWINLMTYDFHGGWETTTNHNAPLYFSKNDPNNSWGLTVKESVERYKAANVPMDKVTLGLPFYGKGWTGVDGGGQNGEYQTAIPGSNGSFLPRGTWDDAASGITGIFDYGDLAANYINKKGYKRYWNDEAKVPFLYNQRTKSFISYDDRESIGHKTDFIESQDLGGAMIWDLSLDCRTSGKYTCKGDTLLQKISDDLLEGGIKGPDQGGINHVNVTYTITSKWGTGSIFNIRIKNTGTSPIEDWKVGFDYAGEIQTIWNGRIISESQHHYVIKNDQWNKKIKPGETVTVGGEGRGPAPAVITNVAVNEMD